MPNLKPDEPEVLPGADPDEDCQVTPADLDSSASPVGAEDHDHDEDDHEHDVTWGKVADEGTIPLDAIQTWQPERKRWALLLEKAALWVERPLNTLTQNHQLNPFYQTGTIAAFLLIIVGLTGLYLFLFFQYGFDASYNAVARIEEQFIARLMRAIHRYASGALVITTLLHAYRTLFMERFRGPRWLAWTTGVVMTALLWGAGVTGYWLVWDERAQLITDAFADFLAQVGGAAPDFRAALALLEGSGRSWTVLLLILAVHVLLFLIVALSFALLHIRRLSRPQWMPETQWVVGMGVVILLVSLLFPAGMLPPADPSQLPGQVTFDPIFLFYLPFSGAPWAWLFWVGLAALTAVAALLPWLSRSKRPSPPTVNIIKERCTGCTKCALDCPYQAITMVERHDGKPHKFIAIEDPKLCVSCGICVGSCDGVAVGMGDQPPELLWQSVVGQLTLAKAKAPPAGVKVVFTCERHAQNGAAPYLDGSVVDEDGRLLEVIPLPCAGTVAPDMLTRTLEAGAAEVDVIGCPPQDCVNREGNVWAEQRLTRERVPRLRRPYADAPILAAWVSPDLFREGLARTRNVPEEERLESRRMMQPFTARGMAIAFGFLALVMALQVLLTDLPFTPYPDQPAVLQVLLTNPAVPLERSGRPSPAGAAWQLRVDEEVVWQEPVAAETTAVAELPPVFHEIEWTPGSHYVQLTLTGEGQPPFTLFDNRVTLAEREVFRFGYDTGRTGDCFGPRCLKRAPAKPGAGSVIN